jgi:hypothetical protein
MTQPHQPSTSSTKPNEINRPPCLRCKRPMEWHSVETVQAYYGPKSVQIFECENCGRLTALGLNGLSLLKIISARSNDAIRTELVSR